MIFAHSKSFSQLKSERAPREPLNFSFLLKNNSATFCNFAIFCTKLRLIFSDFEKCFVQLKIERALREPLIFCFLPK